MDIVNTILEDFPRSKKELLVSEMVFVYKAIFLYLLFYLHFVKEEVGLETDEDCGVSIPSTTT